MKKFNIACVIGTRPEALKMIPVIKALQQCDMFAVKVIITGQHRELLSNILHQANIQETINFNVMVPEQSLSLLSSNLLLHFNNFFSRQQCDLVIAQGDTTTTLIASVSSFYNKIPFAHVEAGLRTSTIDKPFPEEFNRRVTSLVASLHFCPTQLAADNLARQGISKNVYITGNTIIDILNEYAQTIPLNQSPERKLILVTCHRRENFGKPLLNICEALKILAARHKNIEILLPVHPNPKVKDTVEKYLGNIENIILSPPLEYSVLVTALKNCYLVLTDSGGLQEEAPALQKPVLVLRDETERIEAVACGAALLVGWNKENIIDQVEKLLFDEHAYKQMCTAGSPYGDGKSSCRITAIVTEYLLNNSNPLFKHDKISTAFS